VPAVLIGGTSSAPMSLAEKRSVCEYTAGAASTLAASAASAQNPIVLNFIMNSSLFEARRIFALSSEANPLKRIEKVTRLLLSEGLLQGFHSRGAEKM
jgi:hypothetical protein